MTHLTPALHAIGRLLSYPGEQTVEAAELLYVALQDDFPDAARDAAAFGTFLEQHELWEVEETYTRVFDINPDCALEVGWHLFGEEYARGMFLVRMRENLRKYNLPESAELPDHLPHVLAILAAMPDNEASRFACACVLPAVEKMNQALDGKETPYLPVFRCLVAVLKRTWGTENADTNENADRAPSHPPKGDLLRAFPVADAPCCCDSTCAESVDSVPPRIVHPFTTEPPTPAPARKP